MVRGATAAMMVICAAGAGCAISPEGRRILQSANAAYHRGDDTRTVQEASRFLAMHPHVPQAAEAYYLRGMARCRQGRTAEARADLTAAVAASKRDDLTAQAHAKLGEMDYATGNWPEARRHYEAVLTFGRAGAPPCDQALYRLGCMLQRSGLWREADLKFRRLRYLFDGTALAQRAADRVGAKYWSIQAGAFTTAASAEAMRRKLAASGLPAHVNLLLRQNRPMRLVRVGTYPTYESARSDLAQVQRLEPHAFLTPAQ